MKNESIARFTERPANKRSAAQRKLINGIGINDAWYRVYMKLNGSQLICPYYSVWTSMFSRCYSEKCQSRQPSYIGCTVAEEWRSFTAFKVWMETQDWEGKQLDKDVLCVGNKIYSPNTCVFVSSQINALLTYVHSDNGEYPIGVFCHNEERNEFYASCRINGKKKYLGRFDTVNEASDAYKKIKREDILRHAMMQTNDKVQQGLIRHAESL